MTLKLLLQFLCSENDLIEQKYQNVGELIDGKHHAIYAGWALNDVVSFGRKAYNRVRARAHTQMYRISKQ